jgi:hypothetical protein
MVNGDMRSVLIRCACQCLYAFRFCVPVVVHGLADMIVVSVLVVSSPADTGTFDVALPYRTYFHGIMWPFINDTSPKTADGFECEFCILKYRRDGRRRLKVLPTSGETAAAVQSWGTSMVNPQVKRCAI